MRRRFHYNRHAKIVPSDAEVITGILLCVVGLLVAIAALICLVFLLAWVVTSVGHFTRFLP